MFRSDTYLRIIHGLDRFSEDLDFVLARGDTTFACDPYIHATARYMADEGIDVETTDGSASGGPVKKAFIKASSLGKELRPASIGNGPHRACSRPQRPRSSRACPGPSEPACMPL